jgi:hypothetical protein
VSLVVLLILAVVWAVFLVPQVVRARAERTPADSIGAFRNQLSVLERTTPGMPLRPSPGMPVRPSASLYRPVNTSMASRAQAQKRRRDIVFGLLAAMAGSLVFGLVPSLRFMLAVHVLIDLLFVAYIGMLVRARNVATEREMKVRYLPGPAMGAEPALLLRRSGS